MKKENIVRMISSQKDKLIKHAPIMASAVAVAGVIFTVALTVRATVKVVRIVDKMDEDRAPKDILAKTWREYIPPVASGILTISCIAMATTMSQKRYLSMAGLYSVTNEAFDEYKKKTREVIGEEKEKNVREKIAEEKLSRHDVPIEMMDVDPYKNLCFDEWSGRYFRGSMDNIKAKVSDFNQRLVWETWLSVNELYYELGLDPIEAGDKNGWGCDRFCEVDFHSKIAPNGSPCIVMDFVSQPIHEALF